MKKNYQQAARDAGLKDRFGDGWQAVCERHGIFLCGLSEKRKADREKLARIVEALATQYGWQSYRCQYVKASEGVRVHIVGPRGLACSIEFERNSGQVDNYCLPWHFQGGVGSSDPRAQLSDAFGFMQASSVNNSHRRKCTAFAQGSEALARKLETAMKLATGDDGNGNSAFMPPARYIMKSHEAHHPAGAWRYSLFTADWQRLTDETMLPTQAVDYAQREELVGVSPLHVYNATNGRMGASHG